MNQLIRCINCDEVFMRIPFDQCPEYESDSSRISEAIETLERDDFQAFLFLHHGHRLEHLKIVEDTFVSEKEYIEPVKTSYFKATNGKEKFVIKKFRDKIDEPLKYQLIIGDYSLTCIRIEIQSEAIAKQLEREFKGTPLPRKKINAFVKLYQKIVDAMDIKKLEKVDEESSHPLEIYYKPDDVSLVYLLRNCRNLFEGQEYLDIEDFIHRHKEDGVLLLKATHQIQVAEKAKSKKRIEETPVSLEKRKIVKKE